MLVIEDAALLKSGASRQEKASACNGNGAASDEHICDDAVGELGLHVDAAGTKHLDTLFDDDWLAARSEAMLHKISDGASRGRAGGRIFAVVELHACVPV